MKTPCLALRLVSVLMLLVGCGLIPQLAIAQSDFWFSSNGPYAGSAYYLGLDSKGGILAGNVGGVFRSNDVGKSWSQIKRVDYPEVIWAMTINSQDHYFLGATKGHVFHSADLGATWQTLQLPTTQDIVALTSFSDVLYAAGLDQSGQGGSIFTSADAGVTWKESTLGAGELVKAFAKYGNGVVAAHRTASGSELLFSSDNGQSWSPFGGSSSDVLNFLGSDANGNLYGATSTSVLQFSPATKTWSASKFSTDLIGSMIVLGNTEIFVNSGGNGGLMVHSINGSNFKPFGPSGTTPISAIYDGPRLILGTTDDGVYSTIDAGATWQHGVIGIPQQCSWVYPEPSGKIFVSTFRNGRSYVSGNQGRSWSLINGLSKSQVTKFKPTALKNLIAYGGGPSDYWISKDDGLSWRRDSIGSRAESPGFLVGLNGEFFEWGNALTFFRHSSDDGASWQNIDFPSGTRYPSVTFVRKTGEIFVSSYSNVAFGKNPLNRSVDGGKTWVDITPRAGGDTLSFTPLAEGPGNMIYATGASPKYRGGILFRSNDNGTSWTSLGLKSSYTITGITVTSDTIFVLDDGTDSQVWMSTNNGGVWQVASSGLTTGYIQDLEVSSAGVVYAATDAGIYRHPGFTNSVSLHPSGNGPKFTIYPNPAPANATIEVATSEAGSGRIEIVDQLGRTVREVFSGRIEAGLHRYDALTSELPTGVYYCRLQMPNGIIVRSMLHVR